MKFFQKTAFVFFLLLNIFSGNTVEAEGRIYTAKEFEYARLNLEALIERNTRNDNQGKSGENFYIFSTEFADDACELEKVIQHGHSIKDLDCQYLKELNDKLVEINKEANFYVFLDGVRVSDPFVVNEEEAEKIRSKNPEKVDIPILFSYYNNIYKDVEEFTEGLFRQSKLGEIGDQNGALLTITEMLNYLPEYEDNNEVAFITYAKSIVLGEKFKNSYNPIWLKLREKQDEARFSQGFKRALDNHVEACIGEFIHPSEALPCVELLAEYEGHAYLNPTNYFYRIVISNPCVLRDMRALGNPPPESQWMKDLNRVVTAALWVAFAPVAIEVLAPVAIEAAVAMGTEKVITDAALGAVIDAALQATIIYYFDLEEDNRNWEEIEKRIDYYQVTASSIESMFSSRLLEAMISTANSCVVDGYTEGGRLRDSFDGMDCLQGALSNLIITGVLNGGKAFKKLKKYASDNPEQFVGKTIYLIRDNVPSFEMSEETLLKVFEQFGIDPEVVKRVWRKNVNEIAEGLINGVRRYNISREILSGKKLITRKLTNGDKSITLKWIIDSNGIISFGNRSDLAMIIGTVDDEAHHILTWTKSSMHSVVQEAAKDGFHLNIFENGIGLSKYRKSLREGMHGNHPAYDKYIVHRLTQFKQLYNPISPEQANEFIQLTLIPEMSGLIDKASQSDYNLNEYFKYVVNPSIGNLLTE